MTTTVLTSSPTVRRRPGMRDVLRTTYIYAALWLALIAYVLLAGPLLIIAAMTFDPHRRLARRFTCAIYPNLVRQFCNLEGEPLVVNPAPFQWPAGPCIIVANHASMMDSVLLMALPRGAGDGRIW